MAASATTIKVKEEFNNPPFIKPPKSYSVLDGLARLRAGLVAYIAQTTQIITTTAPQDGRMATIRSVGQTNFSLGLWVGLELDDATWKNDSTVNGIKYFDCPPGHGIFVRPTTIRSRRNTTTLSSEPRFLPGFDAWYVFNNPVPISMGTTPQTPRPASANITKSK
ncbi:hypothetical protein VTJ04DRAFT_8550 [Mycothermus thermophilus]|uniref:uncharacterized protein n=1 Tax=Humicola insolens TaxID=85995 RepID=UPI003743E339